MSSPTTKEILNLWYLEEFLDQAPLPDKQWILRNSPFQGKNTVTSKQLKQYYEKIIIDVPKEKLPEKLAQIQKRADFLNQLVREYERKGESAKNPKGSTNTKNISEQNQEQSQNLRFSPRELSLYIGTFEPSEFHQELLKTLNVPDPSIERRRSDPLACAVITMTDEMKYIPNTLQVSPLLYILQAFKNGKNEISTEDYELFRKDMESDIFPEDSRDVPIELEDVYSKIRKKLHVEDLSRTKGNSRNKKRDENLLYCKISVDMESEYPAPTLLKNHYLSDLEMLLGRAENDRLSPSVEEYIHAITNFDSKKHVDILPRKNMTSREIDEAGTFLSEISRKKYSSYGKWPSKYQSFLYQQIAVNLERKYFEEDYKTILSVNGPPGTGKTTILKDIVAGKITDRANILASRECDPDEWFEEVKLSKPVNLYLRSVGIPYPDITGLEMLVVSSNNNAVENITKELPLTEGIRADLDDDMTEIKEFFSPGEDGDIYFTNFANALFDGKDKDSYWGLVSAPLGKRDNIRKFFKYALSRPSLPEEKNTFFYRDYKTILNWAERYKQTRKRYLEQKEVVDAIRDDLYKLEKEKPEKPDVRYLNEKIGEYQKEINAIESRIPLEDLSNPDVFRIRLSDKIEDLSSSLKKLESEAQTSSKSWFKKLFVRPEDPEIKITKEKEIENLRGELDDYEMKLKMLLDYPSLKQKLVEKQNQKAEILKKYNLKYQEWEESQETNINQEPFIPGKKAAKLLSKEAEISEKIQLTDPGVSKIYDQEREKMFLLALELHRDFVLGSKFMKNNLRVLASLLGFGEEGEELYFEDNTSEVRTALLQSLFLMVPVLSSTFASVGRLLGEFTDPDTIGLLLIDEAGQVAPRFALGALERSTHVIALGDPKQIEPVVTDDFDLILRKLYDPDKYGPYLSKASSVQTFADSMNPYGTFLDAEHKDWIGVPLIIHRRCIEPMFGISNKISYGGIMINQTEDDEDTLIPSHWINISGAKEKGNKNHAVQEQEEIAVNILRYLRKRTETKIFIISPFASVATSMEKYMNLNVPGIKGVDIGTVHRFQGKEADIVIFLLGCDENAMGAVKWVNKNIVNVAVTRSRKRFYVVGDREVWKHNETVRQMMDILDNCSKP